MQRETIVESPSANVETLPDQLHKRLGLENRAARIQVSVEPPKRGILLELSDFGSRCTAVHSSALTIRSKM